MFVRGVKLPKTDAFELLIQAVEKTSGYFSTEVAGTVCILPAIVTHIADIIDIDNLQRAPAITVARSQHDPVDVVPAVLLAGTTN